MTNRAHPRWPPSQPPSRRSDVLEFKGISSLPAEIPLSQQSRLQQLPLRSPCPSGTSRRGSWDATKATWQMLPSSGPIRANEYQMQVSDQGGSYAKGGGSLGRQPRRAGTTRTLLGNTGFQVPSQTHTIHRWSGTRPPRESHHSEVWKACICMIQIWNPASATNVSKAYKAPEDTTEILLKKDHMGTMSCRDVAHSILPPWGWKLHASMLEGLKDSCSKQACLI